MQGDKSQDILASTALILTIVSLKSPNFMGV